MTDAILRRLAVVIAFASLSCLASSPPALGWANGRAGCNSFGTHDWILKKAIKAVGADAKWVHLRVALHATDDPDCKDAIDHASSPWWHVYDRWGDHYGDADEATSVWLRRTRRRLQAGHERADSRRWGS